MSKYIYVYNITRYGELQTEVEYDEMLVDEKEIMKFYYRIVTEEDRKRILEAYKKGEVSDVFGYIENNLIEKPCTCDEKKCESCKLLESPCICKADKEEKCTRCVRLEGINDECTCESCEGCLQKEEGPCTYLDLMGDCHWFEGFTEDEHGKFIVHLGS